MKLINLLIRELKNCSLGGDFRVSRHVHARNAAFEAVSAAEQNCSAPLLKVECSVSDRFLKRSKSSLNTFIGAEIATEPRFGK